MTKYWRGHCVGPIVSPKQIIGETSPPISHRFRRRWARAPQFFVILWIRLNLPNCIVRVIQYLTRFGTWAYIVQSRLFKCFLDHAKIVFPLA